MTLIRESDNEHDPNAIRVSVGDIGFIGYVPRPDNETVAQSMDSGQTWRSKVDSVVFQDDDRESPGLIVSMWRVQ